MFVFPRFPRNFLSLWSRIVNVSHVPNSQRPSSALPLNQTICKIRAVVKGFAAGLCRLLHGGRCIGFATDSCGCVTVCSGCVAVCTGMPWAVRRGRRRRWHRRRSSKPRGVASCTCLICLAFTGAVHFRRRKNRQRNQRSRQAEFQKHDQPERNRSSASARGF